MKRAPLQEQPEPAGGAGAAAAESTEPSLPTAASLLRDLASLLFASARARGVTIGGRHPVAEALGAGR